MDVETVAKHYGISPDYVRGYRDMFLGRSSKPQGDLFGGEV